MLQLPSFFYGALYTFIKCSSVDAFCAAGEM